MGRAMGGEGRLHKVFGQIGLEFCLPWQYIAPIDFPIWEYLKKA